MDHLEGARVVVLGGWGFIGSHLVERLLATDARAVTVIDDFSSGTTRNRDIVSARHLADTRHGKPALTTIRDDLTAPTDRRVVEQWHAAQTDIVFNLASPCSPPDYRQRPIDTLRAGSVATEWALRLAEPNLATVVHASSSEVYGDPEQHPQTEWYRGNCDPVGPRSMYDESKRYAEALCAAFRDRVDVRVARIFNTYGPRMRKDDGRVVPAFLTAALAAQPLEVHGDGTQTRSFCHIDDLVSGLIRMTERDVPFGPFNLGSDIETTIVELADTVIDVTGSKSKVFHVEQPDRHDPKLRCPDLTLTRDILGWQPTVDLRAGLGGSAHWYAPNPIDQWKAS